MGRGRGGACRRGRAGFTVLETLIVAVVFASIASAVYLMGSTSQATFLTAEARADLQQNGRVAMNEIVRLLRMAGSDPLETGRFGFRDQAIGAPGAPRRFLAEASASRLAFTIDSNGDGLLQDSDDEIVGFELDPSCSVPPCTLRRLGAGPPQPLADHVVVLRLRYFDGTNQPIPDPPPAEFSLTPEQRDAVRRIRVELTVDVPRVDGVRAFALVSDVAMRGRLR